MAQVQKGKINATWEIAFEAAYLNMYNLLFHKEQFRADQVYCTHYVS